jgi:hypothetical protein
MSERVITFLLAMGNDLDLQHAYAQNPDQVMTDHSLNDEEKTAILKGDVSSILTQDELDKNIVVKVIFTFPIR